MNPPPHVPTYESEEPPRSRATPGAATPSDTEAGLPRSVDIDRDLIRRMAAGDESALGALYDRWVTLVHSLVLRLLADADEAEDVVEEVFWQAWRQAARYEESRGAVSTWLTTIARSRALDRLRARRRRQEEAWSQIGFGDMESITLPAPAADNPLAGAEQAERRAFVARALTALPPEQRETIELAYFGGLSQSEIAERTGQPLGTVKTRVRLAMEKLRESLSMLREGAP
jgi:RNA polymerase sigma-70 factor (ECF subfamily)